MARRSTSFDGLKDDDGEAPVAQAEVSSSRTDAKRYVIHIGTARELVLVLIAHQDTSPVPSCSR